jgi:hypothetical protein
MAAATATGSQSPESAHAQRSSQTLRRIIQVIAGLTCLFAIGGITISLISIVKLHNAEDRAHPQIQQLSATINQVAITLQNASTAAQNGATTVGTIQDTLGSSATTIRGVSDTLGDIAGIVDFRVPGTNMQPLSGVDTRLREESTQLQSLAGDIQRTQTALGQNATDLRAIGQNLALLAQQTAETAQQVQQFAASEETNGSMAALIATIRLITLWVLLAHLIVLGIGIALFVLTFTPALRSVVQPARAASPASAMPIVDAAGSNTVPAQ